MQNTMLDTVVSSNSQELFDFNATHNGEACIASLDPKDRGTERQFRFTRALLCTLLGVKKEDTITNHVDKLLERGAVTVTKNLVTVKIANSVGAVNETTLYDLTVFRIEKILIFDALKRIKRKKADGLDIPSASMVIQNGSGMTKITA